MFSRNSPARSAEEVLLHTFINGQIEASPDLSNMLIAERLGYKRPNVISMFRNGSMKVPIYKVPALADVLGLDRGALLRRAMTTYAPETWATIESVLGDRLQTENEMALLEVVRDQLAGMDTDLASQEGFVERLRLLIGDVTDRRLRSDLAARAPAHARRASNVSRRNAAMADLLDRQAAERSRLRDHLWASTGPH